MKLFRMFLIALSVFSFMPSARADYYIGSDEAKGGEVDLFMARTNELKRTGIRAVLPEQCASSCTLFLRLRDSNLLCRKTETAVLLFHRIEYGAETIDANGIRRYSIYPAARSSPEFQRESQRFFMSYPRDVRRAILEISPEGLPSWKQPMVRILAKDLGVPRC